METDWQKFKDSFEKFVVQDLQKSLKAGVEVGVVILTAVAIECLSGYFEGKPADSKTFKSFINEFMPNYSNHAETNYLCIRNGLAHDYIIKEYDGKSFLFTRSIGERHLIPVDNKPGWYYLNREIFALDFLKAQEQFFAEVNQNQKLYNKVLKRLNDRSFLDVFSFQGNTIFIDSNENADEYNGTTGTVSRKL
jgi:hypothetical protein